MVVYFSMTLYSILITKAQEKDKNLIITAFAKSDKPAGRVNCQVER